MKNKFNISTSSLMVCLLSILFVISSCKKEEKIEIGVQKSKDEYNVIIISLDGARPDFISDLVEKCELTFIKKIAENGTIAEKAKTVLPSLTAVAHSSIITGAYPKDTGIVSNNFCIPKEEGLIQVSGFEMKLEAETLWELTKKNNISTAVICWPNVGLYQSESTNHIYVSFPGPKDRISSAFSHNISLKEAKFVDEDKKVPVITFSKPRLTQIQVRLSSENSSETVTLFLTILDTSDDKIENYDSVIIDNDEDYNNSFIARLQINEWFKIANIRPLQSGKYYEGWFKIKSSKDGNDYTIYCSGLYSNNIQPEIVNNEITAGYGCFPGTADYSAFASRIIDEKTFVEQAIRLSNWIADVTLFIKEKYNPRVLITYQSQIDEITHQFLLVDKKQYLYTEEKSKVYLEYIREAYKSADTNVGKILSAKNYSSKKDIVIILSDHGMCPINRTVNLRAVDAIDKLLTEKKVRVVTSGACAQIYFTDRNDLQNNVASLIYEIEKLNLLEKDAPPFRIIASKENLRRYNLYHQNSGDVFIVCNLGYIPVMVDPYDEQEVKMIFDLPRYYGQHGYDPESKEMYCLFIIGGDVIRKQTIKEFRLVDVASTVSDFLKIKPPINSVGSSRFQELVK